mgnify:CR=1 FL=1
MKNKALAAPYLVWMALFTIVPLAIVAYYAFTDAATGKFTFANIANLGNYMPILIKSIWLALISSLICIVIGYPVAYFIANCKETTQRFLYMLVMLPMCISFLLRTLAWVALTEDTGIINNFITAIGLQPLPLIRNNGAVVLGMVYNYLPFMILPIYSVIIKLDGSLLEAARDLGASSMTVFRRVILPLSLPGVISGITMVFVPSVSTFAISRMLGGGTELLLGDLIERQFLGGAYNPQLGAAISLVMMVIVLVCMLVMNRFGEGEEQAVIL